MSNQSKDDKSDAELVEYTERQEIISTSEMGSLGDDNPAPAKKARLNGGDPHPTKSTLPFYPELLESSSIARLAKAYAGAKPYKHALVNQLFDPKFLKKARAEIVEQVSFREKETDIYRINQTGDLTNLSGLPESELALLPTLLSLRDALYSPEFRNFLQQVTGCGPLSGIKTDMSCAEYNEGCYLLNHDDVIGTRRISFILYLVQDEPKWQKQWGGALELYPVLQADEDNPDRPNVPTAKPSVSHPPAFNQFAFFTVQPGHSFHSVEEVVVEGDGTKGGVGARLSLSGWFHKPVQGEEGYEGEEALPAKSSLQQLYATTLEPAINYEVPPSLPMPNLLSSQEINYLSQVINPAYLEPKIFTLLEPKFLETSQLVLGNFIKAEVAKEIEALIRIEDEKAEGNRRAQVINGRKVNLVTQHDQHEGVHEWQLVGPPHIQRFCALHPKSVASSIDRPKLSLLLGSIREVFSSTEFRSLLHCLTSLLGVAYTTYARRFRPGLDYTLARGEPEDGGEVRLDVGLCLTPEPVNEDDRELWEGGEVGGWEIWLAGEEGGDEATYGAKTKKLDIAEEENETDESLHINGESSNGRKEDGGNLEDDDDEDDDSPLLALQPEWNRLHIVLRDPGVLKFVKYLSARAPASRWDISGEWEVAAIEEDEDEDGGAVTATK